MQLSDRAVARTGAAVVATALAANLLVRGLAGLGGLVPAGFRPLAWGPIVGATLIGTGGAVVVYFLLNRYTARPPRNFTAVAIVVFLASLVPVIAQSGRPEVGLGALVVLFFLHAAPAVASVAGFSLASS
jgi:hypothetical protein